MVDSNEAEEMVVLVATDILTPYRKGEVFSLPQSQANKVLNRDMTATDFNVRNERVKARLFDPEKDQELLLDNHVLNTIEHKKLDAKLHPKDKN